MTLVDGCGCLHPSNRSSAPEDHALHPACRCLSETCAHRARGIQEYERTFQQTRGREIAIALEECSWRRGQYEKQDSEFQQI